MRLSTAPMRGSDGQPSSAELLAPGTTTPGQVSQFMESLSSGDRQCRFGKDHTACCPGLTFPPASTTCYCWEQSGAGRTFSLIQQCGSCTPEIALDHLYIDLPYL